MGYSCPFVILVLLSGILCLLSASRFSACLLFSFVVVTLALASSALLCVTLVSVDTLLQQSPPCVVNSWCQAAPQCASS
jgi:hypothetical protein